jgi:hypothetical protein
VVHTDRGVGSLVPVEPVQLGEQDGPVLLDGEEAEGAAGVRVAGVAGDGVRGIPP